MGDKGKNLFSKSIIKDELDRINEVEKGMRTHEYNMQNKMRDSEYKLDGAIHGTPDPVRVEKTLGEVIDERNLKLEEKIKNLKINNPVLNSSLFSNK